MKYFKNTNWYVLSKLCYSLTFSQLYLGSRKVCTTSLLLTIYVLELRNEQCLFRNFNV